MDLSAIDNETLALWHSQALQAMQSLLTGRREASLSHGGPDGSRAVSYTQASLPDLRAWIASLASELGRRGMARPQRRRAIGMRF